MSLDRALTQTWELVHKAQGGDADALNRLVTRYYERVRRSVRARLGPGLRARMESGDILQSAFARAFANFDRFEMRHEGSLLHYLAEYAERQIHDAVDRANTQKRRAPGGEVSLDAPDADGTAAGREVAGSVTGPIDGAARWELQTAVDEALDQLPEHYRRVIVLRDYDGLEWLEVAERMGKNTDSAARELHRRAQLELAKLLRRRGLHGAGG